MSKRSDEVRMREDRATVDPIRLGPDRQPALSLDAGSGIATPDLQPQLVADFDWQSLARFGLTKIEHRAVVHCLRRGVPRYRLHAALGTTRAEAIAALDSAIAKLGRAPNAIGFAPVQNSRRLAYRERLASGLGPWSLNGLDERFREIMDQERKSFHVVALWDTELEQKTRAVFARRVVRRKLMESQQTLEQELRKLQHTGELVHRKRLERDDAARKLATAEVELQKTHQMPVLGARFMVSLTATLGELQANVAASETELGSAIQAHKVQAEICDGLESAMSARRSAAFALASEKVRSRIMTKVQSLADDMAELHELGVEYSQDGQAIAATLFPLDGRDSFRNIALGVTNQALRLNYVRWQWPKTKSA